MLSETNALGVKIVRGTKFKKDFKKIINNKDLISEFEKVIKLLVLGEKLPEKYKDHQLKGNYINCRECHIKPDLLLIYEINKLELNLYLFRLGSHSELF